MFFCCVKFVRFWCEYFGSYVVGFCLWGNLNLDVCFNWGIIFLIFGFFKWLYIFLNELFDVFFGVEGFVFWVVFFVMFYFVMVGDDIVCVFVCLFKCWLNVF